MYRQCLYCKKRKKSAYEQPLSKCWAMVWVHKDDINIIFKENNVHKCHEAVFLGVVF